MRPLRQPGLTVSEFARTCAMNRKDAERVVAELARVGLAMSRDGRVSPAPPHTAVESSIERRVRELDALRASLA